MSPNHRAMITSSVAAVTRIVGPARGVFVRGLAVAENKLEKVEERGGDDNELVEEEVAVLTLKLG